MRNFKKIGVIGCGLMGAGIAHVSARSGYPTIMLDVDQKTVKAGIDRIFAFVDKGIAKGKATTEERDLVRENLIGVPSYDDLSDCDLIIEAVPENFELKKQVFTTLDKIAQAKTILASNTSSLKITDLAACTDRRDKFIGTHFFNPVPLMKLCEVIRIEGTEENCFMKVLDFIRSLGKIPVTCKDTTGFVVNRLLNPYLLDAVKVFEAGIASIADIDAGMTLGCGYPMGPFTLIDYIGVDTVNHISKIMLDEFKMPQYAPPKLLSRMIESGLLGRKSGSGFYDYQGENLHPNDILLRELLKD